MPGHGAATYGVDAWGEAYELGAARLLYMLRMAPRWRALADVIDARYARIAGIMELIRVGFNLDSAIGNQLDIIGEWLGRRREGMVDVRYRRALRVQLRLLLSANGSGPNLISVWFQWAQSLPLSYRNVPPAYVELSGVVAAEDEYLLRQFILSAAPGGVVVGVFTATTTPLIADSIADPVTSPGLVDSIADPVTAAPVTGFSIV